MSEISKSALGETFDAEFEKKVAACTSASEISELMKQRSIDMGLMKRDWDPDILIPTGREIQPQPQKFAQTVVIDGIKHVVERGSELECQRAVNDLLRENLQPTPATEPVAQPRDGAGKFVSANDAAARAELELKFKRGEIPASVYLAQSGAIDSYLESQGISLTEVKKVAQQGYAADWKASTDAFLERHPEWQGGDANLQEIGRTLERLNLLGAPTVESIEAAYQDMRQRNAITKNPELERQREFKSRLDNAKSYSDIQDATSLFGRP